MAKRFSHPPIVEGRYIDRTWGCCRTRS
jgi:hypothetical protein